MNDDPVAKAQALADRVKNKRQATWQMIKEKDPVTAYWMTDMSKAFGEHQSIKLELDGDVLIDKGTPDGVRDMSVKVSGRRW